MAVDDEAARTVRPRHEVGSDLSALSEGEIEERIGALVIFGIASC